MKDKGNFVYWLIVALLMSLIASNTYFATLAQQSCQGQVEHAAERQAIYDEHAQQLQAWLVREQRTITGAFDNYHADAYNTNVDRIAEQQLIAAEYQLLLLQTIARQNAEIIELMIVAGP